ncbi:MAG: alpha/beta hydrolase, partial [Pseudomonadota bacterium]
MTCDLDDRGFLTVRDHQIEYRFLAPNLSGRPTLVLLHEGLGSVALWKAFPEQLRDATGFGVFVYSRIGYGRSDPCALPRSIRYMHEEALHWLPAILDAARIGSHVLLGHSDGGSIAVIGAASRSESQSDQLKAIMLFAPHFFVEDISLHSIREAGLRYDDELRARLQFYHGDNVDVAFKGWHDAWMTPEFADWNIEEELRAVHVPLLMLQGEQDEYGTRRQIDAVVDAGLSRSYTVLIPECRHSPHFDQKETVLSA